MNPIWKCTLSISQIFSAEKTQPHSFALLRMFQVILFRYRRQRSTFSEVFSTEDTEEE